MPSVRENFTYPVTLDGRSYTVTQPANQMTVLALTRLLTEVEMQGEFVRKIGNLRDSKNKGEPHLRFYVASVLVQSAAAPSAVVLADQSLEWRYEITQSVNGAIE